MEQEEADREESEMGDSSPDAEAEDPERPAEEEDDDDDDEYSGGEDVDTSPSNFFANRLQSDVKTKAI
jgi:hypothetical protein